MLVNNIALSEKIENTLNRDNLVWLDPKKAPFRTYGAYEYNTEYGYVRMPVDISAKVSDGVNWLSRNTAGVRLRFRTDSKHVALKMTTSTQVAMDHMAYTGNTGFDIYRDNTTPLYMGTFRQNRACNYGYDAIVNLDNPNLYKEGDCMTYTINFPLYSDVKTLYIALDDGSNIYPPDDYKITKPFVYYGSSITQGGCASRPGTCYQAYICRRFDADYINLGFSGCAKGEDAMIEYLASLDPSVFICDYDHNAPSVEHLQATHEKLFLAFRKAHPSTPVVFVSRPEIYDCVAGTNERFEVVKATYYHAAASGDENVYLVDGRRMFDGYGRAECTVDGCHPTDLGFMRMASVIGDAIAKAVENGIEEH